MEEWKRQIKESITEPEQLAEMFGLDVEAMRKLSKDFIIRINPYYLGLIKEKGDAIWKQAIPDPQELFDDVGCEDPLGEDPDSPVSTITHRYPDRALFYVNYQCPMYCRFCTRKRKVGHPESVPRAGIDEGIKYIREHKEIRDVIISGGDPLILTDKKLEYILSNLRAIPHLEIIRIGSRVPCTLPQRITPELCAMLKKYHPLYINTHFNHPSEITPESKQACEMLADAGIPLGNQAVLLTGVNDDPQIMKELMQKLLTIRVKPYYIYQADLVFGTKHFRTSVEKGLEIIKALRGWTSGMAVPHYVIDAPGGGGKIAILPNPIVAYDDKEIKLKNYEGNIYSYPSVPFNE